MATDRQIAANRRNARRSAGPRSGAGRKRSGRNSFRHGLAAAATATAERIKHIERLARNIAGASTDVVTLEWARTIAQAEFDLAQITRVQVELISRVMAFGEAKRLPASHLVRWSIVLCERSIAASWFVSKDSNLERCQQQSPNAPPKRCGAHYPN